MSFFEVLPSDFEAFRQRPSRIQGCGTDLDLRLHPRVQRQALCGVSKPTDDILALSSRPAGEPASDSRPKPGWNSTATSLEVSRPSSDLTTRVRSTRVYLTRHRPSLAFRRPSTGFSSLGLLALFHASAARGVQRAVITNDSTVSHAPSPVARSFACYAHSPTRVGELSSDAPLCAARLVRP